MIVYHPREGMMRMMILGVAVLLMVPALKAQQAETKENPPQAEPQEATENSNVQNSLPAAIRPGHPLDPADVDILTGKRDREIEASRQRATVMLNGYGAYGDGSVAMGRRGAALDLPMLPLRRISSPFYFFGLQRPRSFGRRGFR